MKWVFEDYETRLISEGQMLGRVSATDRAGEQDFGSWFGFDAQGQQVIDTNDPFEAMKFVEKLAERQVKNG